MRLTIPRGSRFRPKEFEVTDLGINPVLWWDAADESTVTLNGTTVSQIDDKSGNNLHMVQASAGAQPYYISKDTNPDVMSQMNYKNFLYFENGDVMETNGIIDAISPTNECTIFLVQRNDNLGLGSSNFRSEPNDGANRIGTHNPFNNNTLYWDFGNISTTGRLSFSYTGGYSANIYCYYSSVANSAQRVYQNNYLAGSNGSADDFAPSSHTFKMGDAFTGAIGELIVFDQALTDYQIDQINRQLMMKWTGLPVREDLVNWFDASQPSSITLNGSNVSQWNSLAENGTDLSQGTASAQPIYDHINKCVEFELTDELIHSDSTTGINSTSFVVAEINNVASSLVLWDEAGNTSQRAEQWNNTGKLGFTRYGVADYTSSTNTPWDAKALYAFHLTGGSNCGVRINSMTSWDEFNVGSGRTMPLAKFGDIGYTTGKIYEIVTYDRVLTEVEYNLVRQYLNDKWKLGIE